MVIEKRSWGKLPDGRDVDIYQLGGDALTASITNYGGIIASLRAPDRSGTPGEIGLGYDTLNGYLAKRQYFGALIGRVANRIRDGRFTLEGKEHQLWRDANGIHLHGGEFGFNQKLWDAEVDGESLHLSYLSPDGEEHYPGNLKVDVRYTVIGGDLRIDYEAATDQDTIVNLTNHEFFNLNGCARDIMAHELRITADSHVGVDAKLVPTGELVPVAGTAMDFNTPKPIGRDADKVPGGYDHSYVFRRKTAGLGEWLAEVYDPDSGRTMHIATTEPCLQFYAGNFLDGSDIGIGGKAYQKHFGFCLEAQKHPDAINHPNFASIVLLPGETYRQTTVYRFGTR